MAVTSFPTWQPAKLSNAGVSVYGEKIKCGNKDKNLDSLQQYRPKAVLFCPFAEGFSNNQIHSCYGYGQENKPDKVAPRHLPGQVQPQHHSQRSDTDEDRSAQSS
jgi:hypothetical protein